MSTHSLINDPADLHGIPCPFEGTEYQTYSGTFIIVGVDRTDIARPGTCNTATSEITVEATINASAAFRMLLARLPV